MTTTERELKPLHSPQRSFYGKAMVIETVDAQGITGRQVLRSYDTEVVTVEFGHSLRITIENMHSKTTRRHIREFIIQNFGAKKWHEIITEYQAGKVCWYA